MRGFFSLPSTSPTQNRVYPINNRGAAENEWSDGAPETFRYHAAVRLDGRRVTSVEHAEVVRTVPWFASAEPHDLGGESSVIHMVPRSFHDAPFKPLNPYGAVVVRYLPGAVQLVTG